MKKLNSQKILFLFIIILPILDMSSFIFRNYFSTSFSPSTFIRPIIPLILIAIIFFKNKFKLKIFFAGLLYLIYAVVHLYVFNKFNLEISYGTLTHEMQYLINYSFSILNLFVFIFIFYKKENYKKINKAVLIANGIYILSIYISIFTKTSSTTYLEGQGYKGWFESGNSISSILVLNLFIIFTLLNKYEKKSFKTLAIIELILSGLFLTFLLGTRTGLFGFVIVVGLFCFSKLFDFIKNNLINKTLNIKNRIIILGSIFIIMAIVGLIIVNGSSILERRKYLQELDNKIIDTATGNPSHVTGDILKFKEKIETEDVSEDYISKPMQKSILELYNYANNHNINSTDRRTQQLVFNYYLVKNQSNIFSILFGNGFLNNYGELILEMEIPAFLFNFGIIGFILYFIPFLVLFIYYCYYGIKNIKKINSEYVFLLSGILLSFILSFMLGQLFFNSTVMIIITCINILLFNKCHEINNKLNDKYENNNKKINKKDYKNLNKKDEENKTVVNV